MACAALLAGCELDNNGTPQVIPGPTVPSPVALHAPYVWDTVEELTVWTGNAVSRGSFLLDTSDSNGAIATQCGGRTFEQLILRGPDIDPPAVSVRGIRVRYEWVPSGVSQPELWLSVAFETTDSPRPDIQPHARITLKSGPGWKEADSAPTDEQPLASLKVRYAYLWAYCGNAGSLRIDAITLVN